MIETVLLPFRDKIIYDGIVNGFNVTFGTGSRRASRKISEWPRQATAS